MSKKAQPSCKIQTVFNLNIFSFIKPQLLKQLKNSLLQCFYFAGKVFLGSRTYLELGPFARKVLQGTVSWVTGAVFSKLGVGLYMGAKWDTKISKYFRTY